MVDLQETPAVPPQDYAGDARMGYRIAGGALIALGWGGGIALNVLAHLYWSSTGSLFGHRWGTALGPYALLALGLGAFAGSMGVVLLALARAELRGKVVLPGADYPFRTPR